MQIINVSEVHMIGGLSHICVVAEKQHIISDRTDQASLPSDSGWHGGRSEMKGDSVMCQSRYGGDVQNFPLENLTLSAGMYPVPSKNFQKWPPSYPHDCLIA